MVDNKTHSMILFLSIKSINPGKEMGREMELVIETTQMPSTTMKLNQKLILIVVETGFFSLAFKFRFLKWT